MTQTTKKDADLILHNGKITTLDPKYPEATNLAIKDGRIVGVDDAESYSRGPATQVVDLNVLQFDAQVFCNQAPARQHSNVFKYGFATVAESRSFDRADLYSPAQLVDDKSG